MKQEVNVLEKPFTHEELKDMTKDDDIYIEGVVRISLDDIISSDFEVFLDIISDKLVGSEVGLLDISYKAVGVDNGDILIMAGGVLSDSLLSEIHEE